MYLPTNRPGSGRLARTHHSVRCCLRHECRMVRGQDTMLKHHTPHRERRIRREPRTASTCSTRTTNHRVYWGMGPADVQRTTLNYRLTIQMKADELHDSLTSVQYLISVCFLNKHRSVRYITLITLRQRRRLTDTRSADSFARLRAWQRLNMITNRPGCFTKITG